MGYFISLIFLLWLMDDHFLNADGHAEIFICIREKKEVTYHCHLDKCFHFKVLVIEEVNTGMKLELYT